MDLDAFLGQLNEVGEALDAAGALAGPIIPDVIPAERHVDCGSCTACCHMAVFLRPEEVGYQVRPGTRILARRASDGACVYLDHEQRCTIYETRPIACRAFACVDFVRNQLGALDELSDEHPAFRRVVAEGRRRL
jgi:Fe-S-cluster containining protein